MKRPLTLDPYHHGYKQGQRPSSGRNMQFPAGPSESSIRNILNYSRALLVIETREPGVVSLLMN